VGEKNGRFNYRRWVIDRLMNRSRNEGEVGEEKGKEERGKKGIASVLRLVPTKPLRVSIGR
jgi:hypothetical protein